MVFQITTLESSHEINNSVEVIENDNLKANNNPEQPISKAIVQSDNLDVYEVKAQVVRKSSIDDVDFFRDMEPIISKTNILEISPNHCEKNNHNEEKSKFDINNLEAEAEGWGEELEWADVSES